MYTLMTNDVEHTSIVRNNLNYRTGKLVRDEGIPKLLSFYSKNNVKSTFYFTGEFARDFPSAVKEVHEQGHEIGCHGYSHKIDYSFDIMSPLDQYLHLKLAKETLESIVGKVDAFRAPALRLGNFTPSILDKLGFKTDSSIAPQRFDGPLTFGSMRKFRWLTAHRKPYFLNPRNPFKPGKTKVLEIPVSAALIAYQGTTMRVFPKLNELIGDYLHSESSRKQKPIVFLFHPNEVIEEDIDSDFKLRGNNYFSQLFADKIRRKLKLRNLGIPSLGLLQQIIDKSNKKGHEFLTASQYRKKLVEGDF